MVHHSPHTASLCSVLMAALMVSLFLAGGAAAQTNTSLGTDALQNNTTGSQNTAIGFRALRSNTGPFNTASGGEALSFNTTGSTNTAIGFIALGYNTTGSENTASGHGALAGNTTGDYNTAIGANADVSAGNLTNATAIGQGAVVNASNKIRLGNTAVTVIEGQVALTSVSDKTKKENFQPVDGEAVLGKIRGLALSSWNFIGHDPKQFRHYGPMAQDFFAAFGHDGVGQIGSETTINAGDLAGILMSAVQALEKRTMELQQKEAQMAVLEATVEDLKAKYAYLEAVAAYALTYRYSKNKDATRRLLEAQTTNGDDPQVMQAAKAALALSLIGGGLKGQPAPTTTPPPQEAERPQQEAASSSPMVNPPARAGSTPGTTSGTGPTFNLDEKDGVEQLFNAVHSHCGDSYFVSYVEPKSLAWVMQEFKHPRVTKTTNLLTPAEKLNHPELEKKGRVYISAEIFRQITSRDDKWSEWQDLGYGKFEQVTVQKRAGKWEVLPETSHFKGFTGAFVANAPGCQKVARVGKHFSQEDMRFADKAINEIIEGLDGRLKQCGEQWYHATRNTVHTWKNVEWDGMEVPFGDDHLRLLVIWFSGEEYEYNRHLPMWRWQAVGNGSRRKNVFYVRVEKADTPHPVWHFENHGPALAQPENLTQAIDCAVVQALK